jgi:aryl-alcohol dehydrogenase-like predicted oxidoreductase
MRQVRLPGTDILIARFAFGTASIHRMATARERANLLAATVDYGFTHFDTAPYYGFGETESSLAPMLATNKGLTVATKVGLYPPGGANQARLLTLSRKAAGKIFPKLSRPIVECSVEVARTSLTESLARLGRDRVDIVFLHEPHRALVATDEWLRWLEEEKDRVRTFGIAGDMEQLLPFIDEQSPLAAVVQTSDSLDRREAEPMLVAGRPLQLTYGYVSAAIRRSSCDPQAVLSAALDRNKTGAILISTLRVSRLGQYSEAAAGPNG